MNNIVLFIFILFLINLFLFCFIIIKINEIIDNLKKYDLKDICRNIERIQLNIKFLCNISDKFWTRIDKMADHIYAYDEEDNEVTLI